MHSAASGGGGERLLDGPGSPRFRLASILRINTSSARGPSAFQLLRTRIKTNGEGFIPEATNHTFMRMRPQGPKIAVPNWLIEWSKSRDLFLSLAHNPWVYRPN